MAEKAHHSPMLFFRSQNQPIIAQKISATHRKFNEVKLINLLKNGIIYTSAFASQMMWNDGLNATRPKL